MIPMGRLRWSTWTQWSTGLVLTSATTAIGRATAVREPEVSMRQCGPIFDADLGGLIPTLSFYVGCLQDRAHAEAMVFLQVGDRHSYNSLNVFRKLALTIGSRPRGA